MEHKRIIHKFVEGLKQTSKEKLVVDGSINAQAIKDALRLGFPDITPRTMGRKGWKEENLPEFKDLPDALFIFPTEVADKSFGQLIIDWFETNHHDWDNDFEKMHGIACRAVMKFLLAQNYRESDCTYGKAQKVVNMTFKHIYCLSDGKKREWFLPCHMALDYYTLEWFKRDVAELGERIPEGKVDNWSALKNPEEDEYLGKENKRYYSYHKLVSEIQQYFREKKPYGDLCPLEAEFYIWPDIQLRLCAENLIYQLDSKNYGGNAGAARENKKKLKKMPIDSLLSQVTKTIGDFYGTQDSEPNRPQSG